MRSKKYFYNIITNIILQLFVIIYSIIFTRFIIYSFGSSVNGLVSSITQFLGYIALLQSGVGVVVKAALYKPLTDKINNKGRIEETLYASNRFFRKIAIIFIGYLLVLAICYPLFVNTGYDYFYTFSLIIIMSISTFFEYYFGITCALLLSADQKDYIVSTIQIIIYILNILFIIIASKLHLSIHVIKLITCIIFIIKPIIQSIYINKNYDFDLKNCNKEYKLKNKWAGLSQHIALVIHNSTDVIILTFFSTLSYISVYNIYHLIVNGIKAFVRAITNGLDALFGNIIANNEKDNLSFKFDKYENIYLIVCYTLFTTTLLLILPFVDLYVGDITDINYRQPLFAVLIVYSEFIWSIRVPYETLVYSSNKIKEVKKGGWIEAALNVILSLILVQKYNICGVMYATIVAMTYRTVELVLFSNKNIINRSSIISFKKIIMVLICSLLALFVNNLIPSIEITSIITFIIYGCAIFIINLILIILINIIFYPKQMNYIFRYIRARFKSLNQKINNK